MLKIDRSFTSSVGIDSVNATVTDIIIALADRLNIVTVAEGVETLEQESYLRGHGVDVLQGILLCPADADRGVSGVAGRQRGAEKRGGE